MTPVIKVIQGDCSKVLPTLDLTSVDIVVTSPPYNLSIKYNTYKDKKSIKAYLKWFKPIAKSIHIILKEDGSFFLNFAGSNTQPLLPHHLAIFLSKYFVLQNTILWVKSIAIEGRGIGHYKPVNSDRYLHNAFEYIFHFTKSGKVTLDKLAVGVPYADKSNLARRGHTKDLRCRGNTLFIPYKTVQSKAQKHYHPASFPIAVAEYCIKLHGGKNNFIVDPFAGIFTTGLAAKNLGHKFIGIDIDKAYCKIGAKLLDVKVEKIK
jgi:site-specific DNA-methyltransferase (adenine-specific)